MVATSKGSKNFGVQHVQDQAMNHWFIIGSRNGAFYPGSEGLNYRLYYSLF